MATGMDELALVSIKCGQIEVFHSDINRSSYLVND